MKPALGAPSLVLIAVVGVFVAVAATTGYLPFAAPSDLTLPEAAGLRDLLEIEGQIRRGADPNVRAQVRRDIIRSTPLELTPLEAAVGIRRLDVVRLLERNGARIDAATLPVLFCFAEREKAADIVEYLQERAPGETAAVDCSGVALPW